MHGENLISRRKGLDEKMRGLKEKPRIHEARRYTERKIHKEQVEKSAEIECNKIHTM